MRSLYTRFLHLENHLHHQLVQHSITALRIAVGAVFLGFGILKYFPGVSPAQNLTEATTHILVAAALVIAAGTFRGGRMVRGDLPPAARVREGIGLDSDQKLRIVLEGIGDASLISGLCETNHISEAQFYDWRNTSLAGATSALG